MSSPTGGWLSLYLCSSYSLSRVFSLPITVFVPVTQPSLQPPLYCIQPAYCLSIFVPMLWPDYSCSRLYACGVLVYVTLFQNAHKYTCGFGPR